MKLAEWMAAKGVSDEMLAAHLDIDRSTASRIRRDKLLPSSALIAKITKLTGGAVQPNTFFGLPAAIAREDAA
jgi:transcriptional regulator with XRE-family HTH domain